MSFDYWPYGILAENAILRIPLKKEQRRERESSFLLRASLDTQGERTGALVLPIQQFAAQAKKKRVFLK